MRSIKLLSIVALATALGFTACKKVPVVGETGAQGPAGTNGTNGKDGNANVVSGTVTVTNWTFSDPVYYATIPSQSISQSVLNTGAVLVYVKYAENVWSQLPLTLYLTPDYSSTLEVITSLNQVRIEWSDSDLVQPNVPPTLTFKIVVITSTGTLLSNVNVSDYLEVKESLNLKD